MFGIASTDPLTFVAVAPGLLAVATMATLVPALRATRVNPVAGAALRVAGAPFASPLDRRHWRCYRPDVRQMRGGPGLPCSIIAGIDLGGTAVNYTLVDFEGRFLIDGLCEHPARVASKARTSACGRSPTD